MKVHKLKERLIKKAKRSSCKYRVSAAAIDNKGNVIDITNNTPRIQEVRNFHAEERLLHRNPYKIIKKIIILRIGRSGNILPIDPCNNCAKLGEKFGVVIRSY